VPDAVAVGQHLVVGDQDEQLGAGVLQPHPVGQGAEVVPHVQVPGGPVPGQDPEGIGIAERDLPLDLPRPALCGREGIGDGFADGHLVAPRTITGDLDLVSRNGRPSGWTAADSTRAG
jgi:hypothetical protein